MGLSIKSGILVEKAGHSKRCETLVAKGELSKKGGTLLGKGGPYVRKQVSVRKVWPFKMGLVRVIYDFFF